MRNSVRDVATNHFFDKDQLQEFALVNSVKFGITCEGENIYVSTWYIDDLIAAFKNKLGASYTYHRQEQIEMQRKERMEGK